MIIQNKKLLTAAAGMTFFLGFESGGFQLALLKVGSEFGLSHSLTGLLVTAQFLAIMLMPLCFGSLSDRIGKKRVLALFMPVFFSGCLLTANSGSAVVFAVGAVVIGCGYSVCECVVSAALADSCPDRAEACLNLTQCTFSLGGVTSPLLTNWAMQSFSASWRVVFLLAGGGCLLLYPLMLTCKFHEPEGRTLLKPIPAKKIFQGSALPMLTVVMLLYVGIENGVSYFADSLFALSYCAPETGAYAIAAFWASMALSRLVFSVFRANPGRTILAAFGLSSICFLALGAAPLTARSALLLCALLGLTTGPVWPMIVGLGTHACPQFTGTASSILMIGGGLGGALSPAAMGLTSDRFGIGGAFILLAAVSLAGSGVMVFLLRRAECK